MPDRLVKRDLADHIERLEALAREQGLDYWPVVFEEVPTHFMMEVSVYGLPVRMPHWSFGVRYIYQLVQHRMGHSHLFEVVFPGRPGRAYLANTNSLAENVLVAAHVLGHADFSRNNLLFRHSQEQVGYHIVEQAAGHAHRIVEAAEQHGQQRVEAVLDAALALEQHIDVQKGLHRRPYPEYVEERAPTVDTEFSRRFRALPGVDAGPTEPRKRRRSPVPPHPESDLLWFVAHYAPELEEWERDIFLTVREESFYFYPVFACQIMNEGWACLWHTTLLREADWLSNDLYLDAIRTHSDVVRPLAGERQVALRVNPYHVGFVMWNAIVAERGLDEARRIMTEEDDFGFVRNYLTAELAEELDLFRYEQRSNGRVTVLERDLDALKETLLKDKFNFGAPRVYAEEVRTDGSLLLRHDHAGDGRGLDLRRAREVLNYVQRVWRRPVELLTADHSGHEVIVTRDDTRRAGTR